MIHVGMMMPVFMPPMMMLIVGLRRGLSMAAMPAVSALFMMVFHVRLLAASGLGPDGFE